MCQLRSTRLDAQSHIMSQSLNPFAWSAGGIHSTPDHVCGYGPLVPTKMVHECWPKQIPPAAGTAQKVASRQQTAPVLESAAQAQPHHRTLSIVPIANYVLLHRQVTTKPASSKCRYYAAVRRTSHQGLICCCLTETAQAGTGSPDRTVTNTYPWGPCAVATQSIPFSNTSAAAWASCTACAQPGKNRLCRTALGPC